MTTPSPDALAAADAICKQHGMLPGGYMRDSLAEALQAFAREMAQDLVNASKGMRGVLRPIYDYGSPVTENLRSQIWEAMQRWDTVALDLSPTVATMLGQPITEAERDAVAKDGP